MNVNSSVLGLVTYASGLVRFSTPISTLCSMVMSTMRTTPATAMFVKGAAAIAPICPSARASQRIQMSTSLRVMTKSPATVTSRDRCTGPPPRDR